jgi:hypothetical protein
MGRVIAEVEAFCELGGFRKFLIKSMFHGEPPKELRGDDIFPERRGSGPVYVGADLKEQVNSFGAVRLVRAVNVLGIHYVSLSKSSELIWRQAEGKLGRLSGGPRLKR